MRYIFRTLKFAIKVQNYYILYQIFERFICEFYSLYNKFNFNS